MTIETKEDLFNAVQYDDHEGELINHLYVMAELLFDIRTLLQSKTNTDTEEK